MVGLNLKEEISTNSFFPVLVVGAFEHRYFQMVGHLTNSLVLGTGNLTNSSFQKFKCPKGGGGGRDVEDT